MRESSFFFGSIPPWESRNKKYQFFLRKLNFLGSSSGQLFPLGEWWPRGWSCSPSNKFRAEFSGAYKWQDTAPPFPQPGLLESKGKVQIIETCKSSLKTLHHILFVQHKVGTHCSKLLSSFWGFCGRSPNNQNLVGQLTTIPLHPSCLLLTFSDSANYYKTKLVTSINMWLSKNWWSGFKRHKRPEEVGFSYQWRV